MKIVIKSTNKNPEIQFFENLDNIKENLKKFPLLKGPLEVEIFAINEPISSLQLSKFINDFDKIYIFSLRLYSNNRDTIIAGKFLKIDSIFLRENELRNMIFLYESKRSDNFLHEGTIRSGDRISSNGNLFIIGDVNPGAIISAKKNIYVWGKLLGIALAGNSGDKNAYIASLYLKPLQLRISDVIAIGPKDKPKNYYPEIAVLNEQTITINPYIIET